MLNNYDNNAAKNLEISFCLIRIRLLLSLLVLKSKLMGRIYKAPGKLPYVDTITINANTVVLAAGCVTASLSNSKLPITQSQ